MKELEKALGGYLHAYYNSLSPTTRAMYEYKKRGLSRSIMIAPGRMVDEVEKQLASYRENNNDEAMGSISARLPIIIIAISKDYTPSSADFSGQLSSPTYIQLPADDKDRVFRIRQMLSERRIQMAFVGSEVETIRSLMSQFDLFISSPSNRRFYSSYRFAGQDIKFPVMLDDNSIFGKNIETDHKNLTILTLDITLKETIPLFDAPADDCPNDGKGTDGDVNDPHGYRLLKDIVSTDDSVTGSSIVSAKTPIIWDENTENSDGYSEINGLNQNDEVEKKRYPDEKTANTFLDENEEG